MGYNTDFYGEFKINKPVDDKTASILRGLSTTRRVARNVDPDYGVEGAFYFGFYEENIIDYNRPPIGQPGLWCQWELMDDNQTIQWDQGEKFYNYIEWIEYIIDQVLKPAGYTLNGEVKWFGEDYDDSGLIVVQDNVVKIKYAKIVYE